MRLNEQTPVRGSLKEGLTDIKRKVGKPRLTWTKLVEKDLSSSEYISGTEHISTCRNIETLVELTETESNGGQLRRLTAKYV